MLEAKFHASCFSLVLMVLFVCTAGWAEVIFNDGGLVERTSKVVSQKVSKWEKDRKEEERLRAEAHAKNGKMNDAEAACMMMIDDSAEYYGCKAGLEITRGNISKAESYCGSILGTGENLSYQACLAGTLLASGYVEKARSKCIYFVKIADAYNGCRAGFAMVDGNFSLAEDYCHYIRSLPGRNACLAGFYLAQGDTSTAMRYCSYTVQYKYIYHDCRADVYSAMWSQSQQRSHSISNARVGNTEHLEQKILKNSQEITFHTHALSQEKAEMAALIREVEQNPELLKDPEIRQIYNQFKSLR